MQDSLLVVVALGAYAIKELTTGTEVEAEVEVVRSLATAAVSGRMRGRDHDNMTTDLEVVVESDDVAVALGHLLEDGNLVADLRARGRKTNETLRPTLHGEEWARSQDLGGWRGDKPGEVRGRRRTMYSRPSMSFLLMTLQA